LGCGRQRALCFAHQGHRSMNRLEVKILEAPLAPLNATHSLAATPLALQEQRRARHGEAEDDPRCSLEADDGISCFCQTESEGSLQAQQAEGVVGAAFNAARVHCHAQSVAGVG